jgi:hypothetical protein
MQDHLARLIERIKQEEDEIQTWTPVLPTTIMIPTAATVYLTTSIPNETPKEITSPEPRRDVAGLAPDDGGNLERKASATTGTPILEQQVIDLNSNTGCNVRNQHTYQSDQDASSQSGDESDNDTQTSTICTTQASVAPPHVQMGNNCQEWDPELWE